MKPQEFISSFSYDKRLAFHDIKGSIAHVKMLIRTGIISSADGKAIINGLNGINADLKKGKQLLPQEDIHYAIEKELIKRIGQVGGKMHTARSRNDQVALDLRLYIRDEIKNIKKLLHELQRAIIHIAEKSKDIVMPGYTHLQPAQPVLFSQYVLAYAWMFHRDIERLNDCLKRVNVMPLGSAALAGTSFPIDRKLVAKELGFEQVTDNSMDSVSDRDFAVEFLSVLSILSMHLSRISEEFIVWSSEEFGFIKITEEFTSGSSIMPQKRNPDVSELIRGKTGKVYGNLLAVLTLMKGLPLSYNRDMQEDKPPVFESCDIINSCLHVMAPMLKTIKINKEKMLNAAENGFLCATELADYLAKKGMPFRKAHGIVKEVVECCMKKKKKLNELSKEELSKFSPKFDSDVEKILDPEKVVEYKNSLGGTSSQSVAKQISKLKTLIR